MIEYIEKRPLKTSSLMGKRIGKTMKPPLVLPPFPPLMLFPQKMGGGSAGVWRGRIWCGGVVLFVGVGKPMGRRRFARIVVLVWR